MPLPGPDSTFIKKALAMLEDGQGSEYTDEMGEFEDGFFEDDT